MASKHMPMGSLIIGIDLVPIRAIRGCRSIVGDITTQKARDVSTGKLLPHHTDAQVPAALPCHVQHMLWALLDVRASSSRRCSRPRRLAKTCGRRRVCVLQQCSSEAAPAVQHTGRRQPKRQGHLHCSDVD